jgi:hypothetical protein
VSEVLDRLAAIGGVVAEEELRYQCERRGIELNGDVDDLLEKGLVERVGDGLQAVVPRRETRSQSNRHRDWSDEEILDRVRLWALVVGRPPTSAAWSPTRTNAMVETQVKRLRDRVHVHTELQRLYREGDWPSTTVVIQRFGSLNAASVIAGFQPRSRGGNQIQGHDAPPHKPRWGAEALLELEARVKDARDANNAEALREALYELAVAALTEADRLGATEGDG